MCNGTSHSDALVRVRGQEEQRRMENDTFFFTFIIIYLIALFHFPLQTKVNSHGMIPFFFYLYCYFFCLPLIS